jgi:uncharacterized protein
MNYDEGIRFECQGSGKCCLSRGEYGYVYLSQKDLKRLAKHLELPKKDFLKMHCEETDGHIHLKGPDKTCGFLKEKRCTVYEGRPDQCRTWPFWPENMKTKTWSQEVVPFCAGIGKGRLYTKKEIDALLKLDPVYGDED